MATKVQALDHLIDVLADNDIEVDGTISGVIGALADMAVNDAPAFAALTEVAKKALDAA